MKIVLFLFILLSLSNAKTFEEMYISDCIKCHKDGEISVYSKTKPFSELKEEYILDSLKKYKKFERKDDLGALMRIYLIDKSDEDLIFLSKGCKSLKESNLYENFKLNK